MLGIRWCGQFGARGSAPSSAPRTPFSSRFPSRTHAPFRWSAHARPQRVAPTAVQHGPPSGHLDILSTPRRTGTPAHSPTHPLCLSPLCDTWARAAQGTWGEFDVFTHGNFDMISGHCSRIPHLSLLASPGGAGRRGVRPRAAPPLFSGSTVPGLASLVSCFRSMCSTAAAVTAGAFLVLETETIRWSL